MPGRLEFGFNFGGRDAAAPRADDEPPRRLLLLGDFSGQRSANRDRATNLWTPRRIDIDNFDAVMKRYDPTIVLGDGPDGQSIAFHTLEDFHPDGLFARVAVFRAMQQLRADLDDPARFDAAVARLGNDDPAGAGSAEPSQADSPVADGASPFDQLLGGKAATGGATPPKRAASHIDRLISDAIAPHILPGTNPRQAEYLASVDLAISAQMRELLAHPGLRSLEANWRAVWWLVANADDEAVQIHLLDIDRETLLVDPQFGSDRFGAPLADATAAGDAPWSMLFGLYEFADSHADIALLEALGGLAWRLHGSFVAGASSRLLGGDSWSDCIDPSVIGQAPLSSDPEWRAFRAGPVANRVGLAGPRVLLRLPYGPDTDEIDAFDFTELVSPEDLDAFLWANAAAAIALLVVMELSDDPGSGRGHLLIEDLPAHSYRIDGESHLTPGAECYLGERAAEAMLAAGVMALVSMKNRNAVQVLRLQSMADPPTALTLARV